MGKTYPSYSSWAVTLSVSMTPYRDDLIRLRDALHALANTAATLTNNDTDYANPNQVSLLLAVRRLSRSIEQLNHEHTEIKSSFGYLLSAPSQSDKRVKRGLIDGIGKAMSSLFGTATESEINHLDKNVKLINAKEVAMAHAFNGTLSVLNSTRIAATQNRKSLSMLRVALESVRISHA